MQGEPDFWTNQDKAQKTIQAQKPSQQRTVTSFQLRPSQSSARASKSPTLPSVIFPAVAAGL